MANLQTMHDVQTMLLESIGGQTDDRALKVARRSIGEAYRLLPSYRNWSYYWKHGRIITDDDYSTGTIAFDYTGGSNELELTLSGGTWPTNAAYGKVYIAGQVYDVDRRVSSTVLTLKAPLAPTADIAAGTSYRWFRDTYTLPEDVRAVNQLADLDRLVYVEYVPPSVWLDQYANKSIPSQPDVFTITSDPDVNGRLAVRFAAPPYQAYAFDYVYQRQPRDLRVPDYSTGTVTVSSGGTAVTGTGTAWTSRMVGTVLRLGTTTTVPEGIESGNAYQFQAVVTAVTSATALTIDTAADAAYTAVKYRISDWIDVEPGAMYTAFLRLAEWQFSHMFPRDDVSSRFTLARAAVEFAKDHDVRYVQNGRGVPQISVNNMPIGSDT